MISNDVYLRLKKVIHKLEKQRDQFVGAVTQIEQTLKNEFGCNSLAEARTLLKKLEAKYEKDQEKFQKKLRLFVTQNRKVLKQLSREDYQFLKSVAGKSKKTKESKKRARRPHKRTG